MMNLIYASLTGFVLGCLHAFDIDHLAAVSAFASRNPGPGRAVRFGVLWGLGHTSTLLVLGLASVAFRFVIPPSLETAAELVVGILLVVIGVWTFGEVVRDRQIHIHTHTHDGVEHTHFHSHRDQSAHDHPHHGSMLFIGATHGFAGTASIMVIIPITLTHSLLTATAYLVLFGLGTIVAMSFFAYAIGHLSRSLSEHNFLPWFRGIAGTVSFVIGCVWIVQRTVSR